MQQSMQLSFVYDFFNQRLQLQTEVNHNSITTTEATIGLGSSNSHAQSQGIASF